MISGSLVMSFFFTAVSLREDGGKAMLAKGKMDARFHHEDTKFTKRGGRRATEASRRIRLRSMSYGGQIRLR